MSAHLGNEHAPRPEPWEDDRKPAKAVIPLCTAATGATDWPPANIDLGRAVITGEDWRRLYGGGHGHG